MAKLITAAEAGGALGVTRHRIIALISAGRLPAEKMGMQYLIKPADLAKVRDGKRGRPRTAAKPRKPPGGGQGGRPPGRAAVLATVPPPLKAPGA
jgi:excisionase family DNA binding protein